MSGYVSGVRSRSWEAVCGRWKGEGEEGLFRGDVWSFVLVLFLEGKGVITTRRVPYNKLTIYANR